MNKYYFMHKNKYGVFEIGTKLGTYKASGEEGVSRLTSVFIDKELFRTKFGALWAFNRLGIKSAVVIAPAYEEE